MSAPSRLDETLASATEAEAARSGIAGWIAREDARLDADLAASARALTSARAAVSAAEGTGSFYEEVVLQIAVAAARHAHLDPEARVDGERARKALRTLRVRRDRGARFSDEVEALRAHYASACAVRNGDTGRMLARVELGADLVPSKAPRDPTGDPWVVAVGRALAQLDAEDRRLLFLAYVEMVPPGQRVVDERRHADSARRTSRVLSAGADGEQVRRARDEDRLGDSRDLGGRSAAAIAFSVRHDEGGLPAGSLLRSGPHVTAALVLAEHLGMLRGAEEDEEKQREVARALADRLTAARRRLRDLLRAVELDVPPRYVVPQHAEPTPSESAEVECCAGIEVEDRVRLPCRSIAVPGPSARHPSGAWPRCPICRLPVVPPYRQKESPCSA